MDLLTIIDNLDECYPHFCSTLPSSALLMFTPIPNLSTPLTIEKNTILYMKMDHTDHYQLMTNATLFVFPFKIHEHTAYSITLSCLTNHFIWPADTPLRVTLKESDLVTLQCFAELARTKISLKINDHYISTSVKLAYIENSVNPYEQVNIFCNLPHQLLTLHIYPERELIVNSEQLCIYFNPPLNDFHNSFNYLINTISAFNIVKTRSEPIRILNTRLEYAINPDSQLIGGQLELCSNKTHFLLSPEFVAANHQSIISLPIICHQPNLFQSITTSNVSFYEHEQDHIRSISLINKLTPPIDPVIKLQLLKLLTLLNFDYLNTRDPTNQLKEFLHLHNRQQLPIIKELIESIYQVTITPIHTNTLNYQLHFSINHPLQPFLLALLRYFFKQHRPINTHVEVNHALPTV